MPEAIAAFFAEGATQSGSLVFTDGVTSTFSGVASTAANAGFASALGSFALKTAVSIAISAAFNALNRSGGDGGGAGASFAAQARLQTISQVQPAGNWEIVYGEVRKGGTYIFRHVSDSGVTQTLTENHVIPSTPPYEVRANHASLMTAVVGVDLPVENIPDDNGGLTYGFSPLSYTLSDQTFVFGEADAGKNVRIVYAANIGVAANKQFHAVIVLTAHECDSIPAIYFNEEEVTLDGSGNATGKYLGHVYVSKHLGAAGDPADPVLMSVVPDKWTSAHDVAGHAYLYVSMLKHPDLFSNGPPNVSALVRGKKVYDPRSTLTAWSDNAALCVADYMSSALGLGVAYGSGISTADLIAAANVCDEAVALASGGTQARYTCNGVVNTGDVPGAVIGKMLTAMAGRAVYAGGAWRISAGAYTAPALTLDESHFAGSLKVATRLSRKDVFNGVKGLYVSPLNKWQMSDFPPVKSDAFMAEDNGERIWKDIDLPFTTDAAMAQRLAKIELLRGRQQITSSAPFKMHAYKAQPPDVIALTFAQYGWTAKAFELTEMQLNFGVSLSVNYTLRETSSTVFDWSSSEEVIVDPAPNTNLPNPFYVAAPGVPSATETIYRSFGGGAKAKAVVMWAASPDAQARRYDVQYKKRDADAWNELNGIESTMTEIPDIDYGQYFIRVRAMNALGVASLWAQSEPTFVGLSAPPGDVPWFVIDGDAVAWHAPNDLDVSGYILRFQYGIRLSWGDANALHGGLVTQSPFTLTPRPSGQITLMIKAVDALGSESVNPAYIITDLGDAPVANVVETIDLGALGWPGDIVQGAISGGVIEADGAGMMWSANAAAAMWGFDSMAMWHASIYYEMYYVTTISPTVAGAGSTLTLAHDIVSDGYAIEFRRNGPDQMWSVDSESMWSADDATPMWTAPPGDFPRPMWHDSADAMWSADVDAAMWQIAQGGFHTWPGAITALNEPYDFRVTINGGPTRGLINALVFTVDMPDITEQFDDVVIASGGTRLPIAATYREIKNVSVTVQADGNGGMGVQVIDKDHALGPNVKVLNAAGTPVTGLVDATLKGF